MADVKISGLPASTTPLAGTEVLPVVQGGQTRQVSVANLTAGRAVSASSLALTNAMPATSGGTGINTYAVGDLLTGAATNTLAKLPDVATGNALISGGVGAAPSYGKIGLTTHVSGTLPTANGGTNLSSFTANAVLYATSTSALSASGSLRYNGTTLSVATTATSGGDPAITANGNVISMYFNPGSTGLFNGFGFNNIGSNNAIFAAGVKAQNDTNQNTMGLAFITSGDGSAGTEKARFSSGGGFYLEVDVTTASAANMFIDTSTTPAGLIKRSTSSSVYKTSVETVDPQYSDALLTARPVWYRSLCENDNKDWSWYGLIAEELAEIDPRLVHWGYTDADFDWVPVKSKYTKIVDDKEVEVEEENIQKVLKDDAQLKPNGVQYERISVLLLDIVQRQDKTLKDQQKAIAAQQSIIEQIKLKVGL